MYYRTLHIGLFGIQEGIAEALQSIQPLDRFTYTFSTHAAATAETLANCDIAIVNYEATGNMQLAQIRQCVYSEDIGFHALVVVASQPTAAKWTDAVLAEIDAIWPDPLTTQRAVYEFGKIACAAKNEADLYIANTYLDTLIDSMPEMVWFKQLDGAHLKVNSYFCDIVDKTREDVTGQFHNYIWSVPREDWEKAELTCQQSDNVAIEAGTTTRCDENVSTHGEIRLFDTYKTPIFDEDGSILGTSGFAHDVTLERELKHLAWLNARTDYLTGMYNRRYFYEYLSEHVDEAPFTFIMMDLDNFKHINDNSGHDAGDNALLLTAEIMGSVFPDCSLVRWGGDEFIIVIPNEKRELATAENFDRMSAEIAARSREIADVELTASGGIVSGATAENVDEAVKKADEALYQAKAAGKSRCVFAS